MTKINFGVLGKICLKRLASAGLSHQKQAAASQSGQKRQFTQIKFCVRSIFCSPLVYGPECRLPFAGKSLGLLSGAVH
ncbi:MAG: hypothetical protein MUD08_11185 [Cytophagales bacterium]|jgi:hypothetical protein|nr:hypothetical protein [Cytophagales bacterium]